MRTISPDDVDFEDTRSSLIAAIDRELNYFEFLAAGIHRQDVDERLLQDCMQDIVCAFYRQMEPYIAYWRSKNRNTWLFLTLLHSRWSEQGR